MSTSFKLALINTGLVLLFGFFVVRTYQIWTVEPLSTSIPAAIGAGRADEPQARSSNDKRPGKRASVSKTAYKHITEKNLFDASRTEGQLADEAEVEAVVESAPLRIEGKKIVLYGVVVMEEQATALISDPDVKNRKRATRWVKKGDQLGQYTVDAIDQAHIVFSEGTTRFKVALWDQDKKRSADNGSRQSEPTVVSTEKPPEPKTAPQPNQPITVEAEKKQPASDEGMQIIKTPFGVIKRSK